MSGCGGCSSCGCSDKAQEYRNHAGRPAVKCTLCEHEIVFERLPKNGKVKCDHCGTIVEVTQLLFN